MDNAIMSKFTNNILIGKLGLTFSSQLQKFLGSYASENQSSLLIFLKKYKTNCG